MSEAPPKSVGLETRVSRSRDGIAGGRYSSEIDSEGEEDDGSRKCHLPSQHLPHSMHLALAMGRHGS